MIVEDTMMQQSKARNKNKTKTLKERVGGCFEAMISLKLHHNRCGDEIDDCSTFNCVLSLKNNFQLLKSMKFDECFTFSFVPF